MIRQLKSATGHDMTVGGADLAGQAIKAGLVDELQPSQPAVANADSGFVEWSPVG